jgi:hypothetical protein
MENRGWLRHPAVAVAGGGSGTNIGTGTGTAGTGTGTGTGSGRRGLPIVFCYDSYLSRPEEWAKILKKGGEHSSFVSPLVFFF